jgi:hypothetical protein
MLTDSQRILGRAHAGRHERASLSEPLPRSGGRWRHGHGTRSRCRRRTCPGKRNRPWPMIERRQREPFIELRIVEVLKAELQHLPPLARVRLADVDVGQRERKPQPLARPGRACDKTNPPVIDTPVCAPLQYFGSHEPRSSDRCSGPGG